MSGLFQMHQHIYIEKELSDLDLHRLCGFLVHGKPITAEQVVEPIPETRFELNVVPQEPIIKLSKKEYVDAFFESGELQLGCFNYYRKYDHTEIGDNQEGTATLLAKIDSGVIGGKYGSGFNQYMFCTYIGIPDRETMENLECDSGFIINDPIGFSNAIAESICAASSIFGRCVYYPHKAILGFPKDVVNPNKLSHESGKIVTAAQYFIKPERYSYQKEFRFLWEQSLDVNERKIFDCSSARQYCSPLKISKR